MKRTVTTLAGITVLMLSAGAHAASFDRVGTFTISMVGVEAGGSIFALTDMTLFPNCKYGIMYINPASEADKSRFMALTVAARASGQPLRRIAYIQPAVGAECYATILQY